jgi:HK97 gp10 family phage protein
MSVSVQFTSQERSRFKKDLKAFMKSMNYKRSEALDSIANDVRSNAQQRLDEQGTSDRGRLKNSITITKTFSGGRRIGTETGYGLYIEFGRPPGKGPNTKHLIGWVRRKLGLRGNEAKSAAFNIGRKIAQRGTKAQPFLVPAFNQAKAQMIKDIKKEFKRNA